MKVKNILFFHFEVLNAFFQFQNSHSNEKSVYFYVWKWFPYYVWN